jgi:DNA-binding transcriptional regulator YbjK
MPVVAAPDRAFQPLAGQSETPLDRLVLTAAGQIANRGLGAVSARQVAQAAGSAASAINYNFGGIERLFSSAFAYGAAATADWTRARARELAALPRTPAGAVLALEHVIEAWTGGARSLALLYQEALAAAPGEGAAADWARLWRDFWREAAALFGLGEMEARLLHTLFESEALFHLSTWSPALERAALREMCAHFGAVWLGAPKAPPTGALELAERSAGVLTPTAIAPAAVKIVEAAAELVEAEGLGGLTHRAVAARAGVTTGSVTHHFRTMEDLVAGTIRGQVLAMEREQHGRPPSRVQTVREPAELFQVVRAYVLTDAPWGPVLRRRNLFLAAARRPELAGAGAVIRFAYGSTTADILGKVFEIPPERRSLYAGVLARLIGSGWFAFSGDPDPRSGFDGLLTEIQRRLEADLPRA